MGKKKKAGGSQMSEFLQKAREQGKSYAQAQVEETLELIRRGKLGQKRH
ncbi:MAG: hypothetical protein NC123_16390 [Butyrivibrio sp.]|nr:hypothetical protein [Acetatifactor muris]MCM1561098.1 hypothetical protein [Butyrivibrio sp.]